MPDSLAQGLAALPFQPFRIGHLVDAQQRYRVAMSPDFPFVLHLFAYDDIEPAYRLNWHERLELFVPIEGQGSLCMGERSLRFEPGDVLVVDNMKLHGIESFQGRRRRAMVVSFLAGFVYTLGAPLCDAALLAPFYPGQSSEPLVIRRRDRAAAPLHVRLVRLAQTYFAGSDDLHRAGCKVELLAILYDLVVRLGVRIDDRQVLLARQEEARRLGKLHAFLLARVGERVSITRAAQVVGMSPSTFMRYFKRVTGERFVSYLTRLRMDRAMQVLTETNQPVALVADAVGFPDQAYFSRVFRRHFGRTPSQVRGYAGGHDDEDRDDQL